MTTPTERLRNAMRQRAVRSGAELARRSGQNEVTVRSHLNGTRAISKKAAEAYSRALKVEPAWLLFGAGEQPSGAGIAMEGDPADLPANMRPVDAALPDTLAMRRDVPVLGTAECGDNGAFTLNSGDPIDYVRRPPGIASRKGIYCIYAEGASMEPAYEAGDLVFADPHRPPRPGRDVVVQLRPRGGESEPRCFLKRLMRRQGGRLILRQFNPAQDMSVPERDVVAVHLVLKNHELLGI